MCADGTDRIQGLPEWGLPEVSGLLDLRWSVLMGCLIGLRGAKTGEVPILLPLSPKALGFFYFYANKFIKNSILEILESWALCRNEWFWWNQNWSLLGGDWTIKDEAWLVACLLGLPSPPYLPRLPKLLSSLSSQPWWTETLATTNSNKRPLLLTCLWGILLLLHKNLTQASAGLTEAFYTEWKQTPLSREIFNAVKSHLFQKNSQVDLSVAETEELCNNCASFLLTNIMIKNILGKGGLYFSLHVQVTVYGRGRSGQELNQKP